MPKDEARLLPQRGLLCDCVLVICCLLSLPVLVQAQITLEEPQRTKPAANPARAAGQADPEFDDVRFDPLELATVRHSTLGIRPEESDAYYKLLEFANQQDPKRQRLAAEKNRQRSEQIFRRNPKTARYQYSLFGDVLKNPENFTGELLLLRGTARMCFRQPPDPERPGQEPPYELWVYPEDAQHNPAVVLCSKLPANFPQGGDILEGVEVAGYFFKIYGYKAQDTYRKAPLLIARQLTWVPRPQIVKQSAEVNFYYILLFVACLGFVVLVFMQQLWRRPIKSAEPLPEQLDLAQIPEAGPAFVMPEVPPVEHSPDKG